MRAAQIGDGDILYRLKAIARVYGISPKAAKQRHQHRQVPTYEMGRTVWAGRSTIATDMASREAAARDPNHG